MEIFKITGFAVSDGPETEDGAGTLLRNLPEYHPARDIQRYVLH